MVSRRTLSVNRPDDRREPVGSDRERQLVGARQLLDRVLDRQGDPFFAATAHRDHRQRPATARVARAAPGVVGGDARADVDGDAAIERFVGAAREVDAPAHVPPSVETDGARAKFRQR